VNPNVRLERPLGQGAMGVVWVADHVALGTKVAVKVLSPAAFGQADALARFIHEARRAAAIDSPHVVKVFDLGQTQGGEPFIVMELLTGIDLERRLETSGPLDLRSTAEILTQVCRALERAHALGVVHRDIKPANVFLCGGHAAPFVKLLDFGVSKMRGPEPSLTATGAAVGTPYFMSPEQFMGASSVDHRSDLWSLGVLAYACLTGAMPFVGPSVPAISVAAHAGRFEPASRKSPGLPPAVDAWFARAFRVDPAERFQSARELAESFDRAARGGAIDPYAATRAAPESPWQMNDAATTNAVQNVSLPSAPARSRAVTGWVVGLGALVLLAAGLGAATYVLGARAVTEQVPNDDGEEAEELEEPRSAKSSAPQMLRAEPSDPTQPPAPPPVPPPTSPPAATAPKTTPTPEATALPSTTTSAPTPSRWRKRGIRCPLTASKACKRCCPNPRDTLGPAPACECLFDAEAWDRGER
jgi:serine/threonine-protein kinase